MNPSFCRIAVSLTLGLFAVAAHAADDYSAAEKRVFLDDHLSNIKQSTTLTYAFQRAGKADESFSDEAKVHVMAGADGKKTVSVDYLSGARQLQLPAVGEAVGNPIILYFLEMDVRDMHQQTGGQEAYFRKRIRLALADKATVKPITISYQGHSVAASEVRITPYIEDPLRTRIGKYYTKSYTFTFSDKVPGGVYQLRTEVDDPAAAKSAAPALKTSLTLQPGTR